MNNQVSFGICIDTDTPRPAHLKLSSDDPKDADRDKTPADMARAKGKRDRAYGLNKTGGAERKVNAKKRYEQLERVADKAGQIIAFWKHDRIDAGLPSHADGGKNKCE